MITPSIFISIGDSIEWCAMHAAKMETSDLSKNGILDAHTLCNYANNDPRSSISSSCRSSKCCCSSYDCSYCSPVMSINSESHTDDDTNQDHSIDTVRDEQRCLLPECNDSIQAGSHVPKPSSATAVIPAVHTSKDKSNEISHMQNNVEAVGSPQCCKLHQHHHIHHNHPISSSLRSNAQLPLRLPLNLPQELNQKGWDFTNDLSSKYSNQYQPIPCENVCNTILPTTKEAIPFRGKDDNKAQGTF